MNVALSPGETRAHKGVLRKARAYVALTKPRVIELLLVTTAPVMILAQHTLTPNSPIPNLWLVLGTRSTATSTATSIGSWSARRSDRW
jgi:protoheme IX farnesyltransferase